MTYVATDASGNDATLEITVRVVETTAPTIRLLGANPLLVEAGEAWSDPGATAHDLVDGDVSEDIAADGASTVNTMALGEYSVTYELTEANSRGLLAVPVTRTVIVEDTTAPVRRSQARCV